MKIASFIIIAALYAAFSTVASAQQSPFRSCNKETAPTPLLRCTVAENGLVISDVVWNRGNCTSSKVIKNSSPPHLGSFGLETYNFGSIAMLISDWRCNIIEATIITNKGNWTFTY